MPPEYSAHGLLWWRAQLARFLFRPLPRLLALGWRGVGEWAAREVKDKVKWAGKWGWGGIPIESEQAGDKEVHPVVGGGECYVGVHVRRGDKVSEVMLAPIESFAAAAAAISATLSSNPSSYSPSSSFSGTGNMGERRSERVRGLGCGGGVEVMVVSDEPDASITVDRLIRNWEKQGETRDTETYARSNRTSPSATNLSDGDGSFGRGNGGEGIEGGGVPKSRSGHLVRDFEGVDIASMTARAVLDLWALSRAKAQVLTFSSNYGRLAYELYVAYWDNVGGEEEGDEELCARPVVSLDVLWHDPH